MTETLMVLSTEHKEADWPRDTLFMVGFHITGICDDKGSLDVVFLAVFAKNGESPRKHEGIPGASNLGLANVTRDS